jgi:hypothetical protein
MAIDRLVSEELAGDAKTAVETLASLLERKVDAHDNPYVVLKPQVLKQSKVGGGAAVVRAVALPACVHLAGS